MDQFTKRKLYSYASKEPLNIICKFNTKIKVQSREHNGEIFVIKGNGPALLGRDSALKQGVLTMGLNIMAVQLEERPAFKGIGKLNMFNLKFQ